MKRIYLDQSKWIDLARSAQGRPDGAPFADALLLACEGVKAGVVSFPLSSAHYMETHHIANAARRRRLASLMQELSQFHTIATQRQLIPHEIDVALQARFGFPARVRPSRPFGIGVGHAFNRDAFEYRVPDGAGMDPDLARVFERAVGPLIEFELLAGPTDEMAAKMKDYRPYAHMRIPAKYADGMIDLQARRREDGWHKGERSKRVAYAQTLIDYQEPLLEALRRAGLAWEELEALGRDRLTDFVGSIPLMHVDAELERLHHGSGRWEAHDLNDINAITTAIVYCDVVVTERQWVHYAKRARLDETYGTLLLTNAADLVVPLAAV